METKRRETPACDAHLTDITRREALKKIGKYGMFVPATMVVLTAAPRAFAQSEGELATLRGTVLSYAGSPIEAVLVEVECEPEHRSDETDSAGRFEIIRIPAEDWDVAFSLAGEELHRERLSFEKGIVFDREFEVELPS